ncbi:MAG: DnaJ domain-containing protein [Pleurocapsa sp.]
MTTAENYYLILEIAPDATTTEIKAAFRRLARQYHPDLNPHNPTAAEKFKQISQAYDILSDTTKRRRYDRNLNYQYKINSQQPPKVIEPKTAQDFYLRGIRRTQLRNYRQAVEDYTKAIKLDSKFIDAYLKRCEMRYKLGDNQGVLDDCYQIFAIKPTIAKAHYYQGRARYSLGYTQSAIESYTMAIAQEENYAQAYYYRGLAYKDLSNHLSAVEDFQNAAELFHQQNNYEAYRRSKKIVKDLVKTTQTSHTILDWLEDLIKNVFMSLAVSLFNPGGGLLPAFSRLNQQQVLEVAVVYGGFSSLSFVTSGYLLLPGVELPVWQLWLSGCLPFFGLTLAGKIIRSFERNSGNWSTDVFIAGATLIPLSLASLLIGLVPVSAIPLVVVFLLFGFCYSIITLYSGCTQILNLPEEKATFTVFLMLLISTWLSYFALRLLL